MFSSRFSVLAALSAAGLAVGQTFSECNPIEGAECPPNEAFGGTAVFDFSTSGWDDDRLEQFWDIDPGLQANKDRWLFSDAGGAFTIKIPEDAPTITSHKYMFFGRVDVEVQAAPGQGIITAITLQSDILDEIDWEWIGLYPYEVQSNMFMRGEREFNTYSTAHHLAFDSTAELHTYSFEWTTDHVTFMIDGAVVKTHTNDGGKWPQTPCQLKLGTWVAGKEANPEGTITWGGGLVQWEDGPFVATMRKVTIVDYMGGSGCTGATEYEYTDASGTWQSINVVGCGDLPDSNGSEQEGHDDDHEDEEDGEDEEHDDDGEAETSAPPETTSAPPETTSSPVDPSTSPPLTSSTTMSAPASSSNATMTSTSPSAAPTETSDESEVDEPNAAATLQIASLGVAAAMALAASLVF